MATTKLTIAMELLDRALRLYYEGDSDFSSLHLAGAAEEIIGTYLTKLGKTSTFHETRSFITEVANRFDAEDDDCSDIPTEVVTTKTVHDLMAYAKNNTKHMSTSETGLIAFDPRAEVRYILDRVVADYYRLIDHLAIEETTLIRRFNQELLASTKSS